MKTITKYFIASIIILLFNSIASSQPITWKRVYGTAYDENGRVVQQTFDGGYIVGYNDLTAGKSGLLKLNPYGQIEWDNFINYTTEYQAIVNIILTSDGGFLLQTTSTSNSRIIKTDSLGSIQWTKNYRYDNYETTSFIFKYLPNGNYLLGGHILGFNPPYSADFLAYFDSDLDLIWQANYRDSASNTPWDVIFHNNNFYMTAQTHNGGVPRALLAKFDIKGNFLWRIYTPISYLKIIPIGDLFYCGGISFQIIDTTGYIFSSVPINNLGNLFRMTKTHDNKFVILSANGFPDYDAIFIKVDSVGNELFRKYISAGDSTLDALYDIQPTADSGFIMTGATSYGALHAEDANIFIVKTDSKGNSPPVKINQISSNIPEDFILHQNYPNPFNPTTTVRFEIPRKENVRIVLYNILGREITVLVDKELEEGVYSININFNELKLDISSGIYFIHAAYGGTSKTIKIIFNK